MEKFRYDVYQHNVTLAITALNAARLRGLSIPDSRLVGKRTWHNLGMRGDFAALLALHKKQLL